MSSVEVKLFFALIRSRFVGVFLCSATDFFLPALAAAGLLGWIFVGVSFRLGRTFPNRRYGRQGTALDT
jgi:hypothetical protein